MAHNASPFSGSILAPKSVCFTIPAEISQSGTSSAYLLLACKRLRLFELHLVFCFLLNALPSVVGLLKRQRATKHYKGMVERREKQKVHATFIFGLDICTTITNGL